MATEIWVNIGLWPEGTKLLPKPMLTDQSSAIHIRAISQEMHEPSITKICLKIKSLKFHPNFSGANELTNNEETDSIVTD